MRKSEIKRKTTETEIELCLNLDGSGQTKISSGIPFFDHMLCLFCVHGLFDLTLTARGDLEVDAHHVIEDIGICLGQAIKEALGKKEGINRYGQASVPMDESLAQVFIDLSGRPFFFYQGRPLVGQLGQFDLELTAEFFRALSNEAKMNLHIHLLYGENKHHCAEAIFKACGRSLRQAVCLDPRRLNIPSSKGVL
ncbi:MAG TPA: imidazoleglycerol-phosphate dehydratase HisB [Candidatus Desulfofervidus auxilii]|uniref:Imidazoleglycerol-phosphate dehydratase n=1 Tax=Desulfofervidus auxilii TaxID=1621989 RepID=A0A7C2A4A5_DESA2|nr:Imidazoleglycerol-phosphate dehydratase [Candidatus Methanoperedenaceae archaeon GB50]HEC68134.1 imidazoleglycerol-phosphate dehydratase HisB [Candidatus Desulfofervidus auxilii]